MRYTVKTANQAYNEFEFSKTAKGYQAERRVGNNTYIYSDRKLSEVVWMVDQYYYIDNAESCMLDERPELSQLPEVVYTARDAVATEATTGCQSSSKDYQGDYNIERVTPALWVSGDSVDWLGTTNKEACDNMATENRGDVTKGDLSIEEWVERGNYLVNRPERLQYELYLESGYPADASTEGLPGMTHWALVATHYATQYRLYPSAEMRAIDIKKMYGGQYMIQGYGTCEPAI